MKLLDCSNFGGFLGFAVFPTCWRILYTETSVLLRRWTWGHHHSCWYLRIEPVPIPRALTLCFCKQLSWCGVSQPPNKRNVLLSCQLPPLLMVWPSPSASLGITRAICWARSSHGLHRKLPFLPGWASGIAHLMKSLVLTRAGVRWKWAWMWERENMAMERAWLGYSEHLDCVTLFLWSSSLVRIRFMLCLSHFHLEWYQELHRWESDLASFCLISMIFVFILLC